MIARRSFLSSVAAFVAAPAIVRASSLMAISPVPKLLSAKLVIDITDDVWEFAWQYVAGTGEWTGEWTLLAATGIAVKPPLARWLLSQ